MDAKNARQIPNLREDRRIIESRGKIDTLEADLVAIRAEITAVERSAQVIKTGRDVDAEAILAGKPLERQQPAGVLGDLRRKQEAIVRALELQREAPAQIERDVIAEACQAVEPIARKYGLAVIAAYEQLQRAIEAQDSMAAFLRINGFRRDSIPAHWEPRLEQSLLNNGGFLPNLVEILRQKRAAWGV